MVIVVVSICLAISLFFIFLLDVLSNSKHSYSQHIKQAARFVRWETLGIIVGALFGVLLNNFILVIVFSYVGLKLPGKVRDVLRSRSQKEIDKNLEPVLQQLANVYGLSGSYERALEQVIPAMSEPLKGYFEACLQEIQRTGFSLEEALERLNKKIDNKTFHFFNQIILLNQRYGGDSRELMLQVPQTIRDRQLMTAELEAELSGAKQQSWILLGLTPLFLAVFHLIQPEFARILTETNTGRIGLAIVGVLMVISYFLMEKIMED